jgi:hypothetical protein
MKTQVIVRKRRILVTDPKVGNVTDCRKINSIYIISQLKLNLIRFEVSNAMNIKIVVFYVTAQSFHLVLLMRKILSSYSGTQISYLDFDLSWGFPSFSHNYTDSKCGPQPLPYMTVPIYYSLIILPFEAVQPGPKQNKILVRTNSLLSRKPRLRS